MPRLRGVNVVVLTAARQRIEQEVASAGELETGGVLLGWHRPDLAVSVIARATGPGRCARRSATRLVLDTADLQREIDAAFEESDGLHAFLGDWHLHHERSPRPSGRDVASLRELTRDPVCVPHALLLIVGRSLTGELHWRAWAGPSATPADVVLAGTSAQRARRSDR